MRYTHLSTLCPSPSLDSLGLILLNQLLGLDVCYLATRVCAFDNRRPYSDKQQTKSTCSPPDQWRRTSRMHLMLLLHPSSPVRNSHSPAVPLVPRLPRPSAALTAARELSVKSSVMVYHSRTTTASHASNLTSAPSRNASCTRFRWYLLPGDGTHRRQRRELGLNVRTCYEPQTAHRAEKTNNVKIRLQRCMFADSELKTLVMHADMGYRHSP